VFRYLRAVAEPPGESSSAPFIVGAMMTPDFAHYGQRLLQSCRSFALPLALYEVPAVHRSISQKGDADLSHTKASFVHFLLERFGRPVLYLDVDCVVAQRPARVEALLDAGVDFAIYNWLADEHTEAYVPMELTVKDASGVHIVRDRLYRFSHSIDLYDPSQLICSGPTQFYNNSPAARRLLTEWHEVIESSPRSADDHCLDFAFNNYPPDAPQVAAAWLDKSYARYPWWICTRPVIDHPDFPGDGQGFDPIDERDGKHRFHASAAETRAVEYVFPRDCLIDVQSRTLFRVQNQGLVRVGSFVHALWL
jgi:hypothetical protein